MGDSEHHGSNVSVIRRTAADLSQDSQDAVRFSDVLDVIETDLTSPQHEMHAVTAHQQSRSPCFQQHSDTTNGTHRDEARIVIIEQPASRSLRFRYECEGRSAGSLQGVSSTPDNKTQPSIEVRGYRGPAVVVVSCVTKQAPFRPHPHNLVGKEGCKKGVCTLPIDPSTMSLSFSNLGIQCVKKRDIDESLKIRENIRVDPFHTGFEHARKHSVIDLNVVRLCFQVFIEGSEPGRFVVPLQPVVSDMIYDKKSLNDLVIYKLSEYCAPVSGGKEIILLCDKVSRDDIEVHFVEKLDEVVVWEAKGRFSAADIHKQVAISLRTPAYHNTKVDKSVCVNVHLYRPSDQQYSEPRQFLLTGVDAGMSEGVSVIVPLLGKRSRTNTMCSSHSSCSTVLPAQAVSLNPAPLSVNVKLEQDADSTRLADLEPSRLSPHCRSVCSEHGGVSDDDAVSGKSPPVASPSLLATLANNTSNSPHKPSANIELDLSRLNSDDLKMLSFPSMSDINLQAIDSQLSLNLSQNLSFAEAVGDSRNARDNNVSELCADSQMHSAGLSSVQCAVSSGQSTLNQLSRPV